MNEPGAHFFRHEFGRLGGVLTRSLGVRRLDLVEDVPAAYALLAQMCFHGARPELLAGAGFLDSRRIMVVLTLDL